MRRTQVDEIEVKVGRIGGVVQTVTLNGDRTVSDALEAAGLNPKDTETVRVNGSEEEVDCELEDGDKVTLVKDVSGGQ